MASRAPDGSPSACRIRARVASPGGPGPGVGELPAQRDALGGVLQGGVELAPLVGHLGQAHVGDAGDGQGRPAGGCGDLQPLPVGSKRRVQAALGALDVAEKLAGSQGRVDLTGRSKLGHAGGEGGLGFGQHTAEQLGGVQVQPGGGRQHELFLTELGQGLAVEGQTSTVAASQPRTSPMRPIPGWPPTAPAPGAPWFARVSAQGHRSATDSRQIAPKVTGRSRSAPRVAPRLLRTTRKGRLDWTR
jgi:hypothetical protein